MDCKANIEKLLLPINATSEILLTKYHPLQKDELIYTVALTFIFVHFLLLHVIISTVVFPFIAQNGDCPKDESGIHMKRSSPW